MPKQLPLTDDIRQDEPLAYLVMNVNSDVHEYRVFVERGDAQTYADCQQQLVAEADQVEDWPIYPLYAGAPLPVPTPEHHVALAEQALLDAAPRLRISLNIALACDGRAFSIGIGDGLYYIYLHQRGLRKHRRLLLLQRHGFEGTPVVVKYVGQIKPA